MDKDELKKALCTLEDQLTIIKWNIYPMSKDFDWIESAIRIIETIVTRMSADKEATEDE